MTYAIHTGGSIVKTTTLIVLVFGCLLSASASAHECDEDSLQLVELLNTYSEATGTKFVVDPRVSARVNIVGIETENIDAKTLIGILNIHGFSALTSNGIVYVLPDPEAERSGDRFGKPWKG